MRNKAFCVLISFYKGEKYIETQLNSIAKNNSPLDIIYRIDGSTSNDVIQNFASEHSLIKAIRLDFDSSNLGPANSYWKLIDESPDYDFYFLCDQDDIWFNNKVQKYDEVFQKNLNIPLMVFSALIRSDNKPDRSALTLDNYYLNSIFENPARGCTISFNDAFRKIIVQYPIPYGIMHDHWIYFLAARLAKIEYLKNPLIEYRIHDENAVGLKRNFFSFKHGFFSRRKFEEYLIRTATLIYYEIKYFEKTKNYSLEFLKSYIASISKSRLRQNNFDDYLIKIILKRKSSLHIMNNQIENLLR